MLYCAQLPTKPKCSRHIQGGGAQRARAPPYFAKYFKNSPKLTKIYPKKFRGQTPQVPPPFLQILDPPLISVYFTTKTNIGLLYFGFAIYRYRPILHIHDIELKTLVPGYLLIFNQSTSMSPILSGQLASKEGVGQDVPFLDL